MFLNKRILFSSSMSPSTISKFVASPFVQRTDSLSSNASSLIDDTVRSSAFTTIAATNIKQQQYTDGPDQRKIMKYFINFVSR